MGAPAADSLAPLRGMELDGKVCEDRSTAADRASSSMSASPYDDESEDMSITVPAVLGVSIPLTVRVGRASCRVGCGGGGGGRVYAGESAFLLPLSRGKAILLCLVTFLLATLGPAKVAERCFSGIGEDDSALDTTTPETTLAFGDLFANPLRIVLLGPETEAAAGVFNGDGFCLRGLLVTPRYCCNGEMVEPCAGFLVGVASLAFLDGTMTTSGEDLRFRVLVATGGFRSSVGVSCVWNATVESWLVTISAQRLDRHVVPREFQ